MEQTPEQIVENEVNDIQKENTQSLICHSTLIALSWVVPIAVALAPHSLSALAIGAGTGVVCTLLKGEYDVDCAYELGENSKLITTAGSPWKDRTGADVAALIEKQNIDPTKIAPLTPEAASTLSDTFYDNAARRGFITVALTDASTSARDKACTLFRVANQIATQKLDKFKARQALTSLNDFLMFGGAATALSYIGGDNILPPQYAVANHVGRYALTGATYLGVYLWQQDVLKSLAAGIKKRADKLASLHIGSAAPGLELLSRQSGLADKMAPCLTQHEDYASQLSVPRCDGTGKQKCGDKPCYAKPRENPASPAMRMYDLIRYHKELVTKGVWNRLTRKPKATFVPVTSIRPLTKSGPLSALEPGKQA